MKITPNKSGFDRLFLYSFVAISFLINNWTSERLFIPYKKQKVCLNLKVWGEFSRRSQMHSQAGWRMWSLQLDVGVLRPPLWQESPRKRAEGDSISSNCESVNHRSTSTVTVEAADYGIGQRTLYQWHCCHVLSLSWLSGLRNTSWLAVLSILIIKAVTLNPFLKLNNGTLWLPASFKARAVQVIIYSRYCGWRQKKGNSL